MGFIFIRFLTGPQASVARRMAPYADELSAYRMEDLVPAAPPDGVTLDVNWKSVRDVDNEGYHVAMAHPALHELYGATYFDHPYADGVSRSEGRFDATAGRLWSVRNYMALSTGPHWLDEDKRRLWSYFGLFPNTVIAVTPELVQFYQEFPLGVDCTLIRGAVYRRPDETREQRLARYLATRIDRETDREDIQLSDLVERIDEILWLSTVSTCPISNRACAATMTTSGPCCRSRISREAARGRDRRTEHAMLDAMHGTRLTAQASPNNLKLAAPDQDRPGECNENQQAQGSWSHGGKRSLPMPFIRRARAEDQVSTSTTGPTTSARPRSRTSSRPPASRSPTTPTAPPRRWRPRCSPVRRAMMWSSCPALSCRTSSRPGLPEDSTGQAAGLDQSRPRGAEDRSRSGIPGIDLWRFPICGAPSASPTISTWCGAPARCRSRLARHAAQARERREARRLRHLPARQPDRRYPSWCCAISARMATPPTSRTTRRWSRP